MLTRVADALDLPVGIIEEVLGKTPLESFAGEIERVLVTGLEDQALERTLSRYGEPTVLFTGRDVLHRNLLNLPGWQGRPIATTARTSRRSCRVTYQIMNPVLREAALKEIFR